MHRFARARWSATAALVCGLTAAGCSSDSTGPGGTVKDYFTAVQAVVNVGPAAPVQPSAGAIGPKSSRPLFNRGVNLNMFPPQTVNATYHSGTPPAASGGPTATGSAGSTALLGQPYRFSIVGSGTFSTVYLWVTGATGYWQLDLPASAQQVDLVLTLAASLPSNAFGLESAVGTGSSVGAASSTEVTATDLSNADIAVTLKWTGASDVDLHVIDAKQQEVYWNNTTTPEGGRLDLDSNAGCQIDNINQETISWPQGTAPSGSYTIVVHYYADCGQATAPWTLTLNEKGKSPQTFTGTFSGTSSDTQSSSVTTFTYP